MRVEPHLQPLTGEAPSASTAITQDGARLDVEVSGFWGGRFEHTFIDIRIFNPHASSNRNSQLSSSYRRHKTQRNNLTSSEFGRLNMRLLLSSSSPLILSASGGMAREATILYKKLASLLSMKREQPYSSTMTWLRCLLSFSLLRSAIQSIRGGRSSKGHPISNNSAPSDLINSEALLPGSY